MKRGEGKSNKIWFNLPHAYIALWCWILFHVPCHYYYFHENKAVYINESETEMTNLSLFYFYVPFLFPFHNYNYRVWKWMNKRATLFYLVTEEGTQNIHDFLLFLLYRTCFNQKYNYLLISSELEWIKWMNEL
jgi:hypothetical protein